MNIKTQGFTNIRKAKLEDMDAVLDLIQELAVFENQPNAVVITAADLARDGFGPNPLFHVLVAEIESHSHAPHQGKEIVGMALYYYRFSTWKGKTIHLEDLIVKEKMRGMGIGYALYSEIIKQAKKDAVRRVEWIVLDWNTPAIEFYKKSGAKLVDTWLIAQMDQAEINHFLENKIRN